MSKLIPVNPNYDWDKPPTEQADYVNPGTLANKVVFYANKIIDIADRLTAVNTELTNVRLELAKLKTRKEDIEFDTLAVEDFSQAQTKNMTLLTANLRSSIQDGPFAAEYQEVCSRITDLEAQKMTLEMRKDSGDRMLDALKLVSQNIQTTLSFYKAELKLYK